MYIDDFTLFSGAPIGYKNLIIKQPLLYDIGKMGEQTFYDYISYFLINKDKLLEASPNKEQLQNITMTKFIMLLIIEQPDILNKINFLLFLLIERLMIIDSYDGEPKLKLIGNAEEDPFIIEDNDWNEIIGIIKQIFCITGEVQYNVNKRSSAASRIADKMKSAKKKIENMKNSGGFQPMLTQYCSILSVGLGISVNEIIKTYTLYQLMHELKRFNKHEEYYTQLNAMVHGAKIDKLTTWYGNINENNSSKLDSTTNQDGKTKSKNDWNREIQVNNKKRN